MKIIEAFRLALELSIDAPTEEKSQSALSIAESIALSLTNEQIEEVKSLIEGERR